MWFDSWSALLRIVLVGAASYATLVVLLRISGKRVLAKLNAFDFVVTVALGSMLASAVLTQDIRYADVLVGMGLLILTQWLVTRLTVSLPVQRRFITAEPTLLVRRGEFLEPAMTSARLTRDEVLQAIRSSGHGGLGSVAAVVLESDGTLSVITDSSTGDEQALANLAHWR
ncbi:DUF421 domain-containing protein [Ornithinimicrobium sufpigmenti]|uniref:DUF421 domain-containing protein n=1 Tax=Ornithinimicrobium sufpigmenti TaxID=2508882 RepID=UPI0010365D0C|nr:MULTISPECIES: YetF domain-containing protein [unclassified Ornithinimicrobium]